MLSDGEKNTVQAKQWLDKCYLDSAPLETMVKRWYADFKCSHTDKNDAERSGSPNLAVVLENTKKLNKLFLADHKLKLCEIAEELKISEGSVFTILHEHLSMKKLCSKWVPHFLTVDQKQQCVNDSEHCLQLFQCNKNEFLHNIWQWMKWIHHFPPESNRQSAEWTAAGESCSKWPKTQTRQDFGLHILGCTTYFIHWLPWERKKHQEQISYSINGAFEGRNYQKTATNEEEKNALSPRQYTMSQVDCNDGKTMWIALQIASTPTLFSWSGPQWLISNESVLNHNIFLINFFVKPWIMQV